MAEWSYPSRVETAKTLSFNINEMKFNEGYAQRSPKRLEPPTRKWSVVCDLPWAESVEALRFLEAHAGCRPFFFSDPHTGESVPVICKEDVNVSPRGGSTRAVLTATFEEVR